MSLKTYFKMAIFGTVIALFYIHMQMRIFELAYKGKDKERFIHELVDTNGVLMHQVLTLKSANHLGNQLLDKDSNLQFMSKDRVMTVVSPRIAVQPPPELMKPKIESTVWNLLSLLGIQEAKAWE